MRVLVVDDHAENRYLLRALLQGYGYVIDEASNGAEAITRARLMHPDLIISDLLMPVMDGYSLLRRWKSDPHLKKIPFVVYTATYTDPRDERLAMALGADAYLVKPSEPETFMDCIHQVIASGERGELLPAVAAPLDDAGQLQTYNDVLIHKLEKKAAQLEQINAELVAEITHRRKSQAALQESEKRYRTLFDSITDPLFVYDRETLAYLEVNDAAVHHYGYSREEFLKLTLRDIRPVEEVPKLLEMLMHSFENFEHRGLWKHRKKDGSIIDVEISAYGLNYQDRPACLVAARDVSERLRFETKMMHTSRLLQAVADGTPDALFIKDREGKYLLFNRAASRFVGKPIEEVLGRDDLAVFNPESAHLIMTNDRLVMETGQSQSLEELLDTPDGPRMFQALKAPYLDEHGNVIGVIGSSRDITEGKSTEEALRLRDHIIQELAQGILITDATRPENPIIDASRGVHRLTGYSRDELLGKTFQFLQGPETDDETSQLLSDSLAAGKECNVELVNYRKDGSIFYGNLAINPVHDKKGLLKYFVGILSDVSQRKRLEDQLRQSQKMEAVGRLAGGVAHDFNNLLTIITGYSEILLEQQGVDTIVRESAHAISEASSRAASLTRQLLGFSRKSILQPKVLDVNSVVSNIAAMLRRLIGEDIELVTNLAPFTQTVRVDPGQLDQILMNLAVNARDAMPRGGRLTISTSNVHLTESDVLASPECKPGRYVMLSVSDTGVGMTPETLPRIFEPFFTTKEIGKGTGLGLPMVLGIVQQSGGAIHVESQLNEGTVFKIYLPTIQHDELQPTEFNQQQPLHGTETVLITEDEEAVRRLAEMSLRKYGYHVIAAASGLEAIQKYASHQGPVHLLLADVVMPGMSGPELAETLRQQQPPIKVLLMSGYTDDAVIRHGLLEDEINFIQKPFTPLALAEKIRAVLDAP